MSQSLIINDTITIDSYYIEVQAVRSSGPGGQNVNKTSTKIQLKFDFATCSQLPEHSKEYIRSRKTLRFDSDGKLMITSQESRSQKANLDKAYAKLKDILQKSLLPKKKRLETRPNASSVEKRIVQKKKLSEVKKRRSERITVTDE